MSRYYIASSYVLSGACIYSSNIVNYQPKNSILNSHWNLLKVENSPFPQIAFVLSPFLVPVFSIGLPISCVIHHINKITSNNNVSKIIITSNNKISNINDVNHPSGWRRPYKST